MANKYTYSAPYTDQELHDMYVTQFMTQTEIATKYGISQHKVLKDMRKMGLTARHAYKRDQRREENDSWKGGRILVNHKTPDGHRFLSTRSLDKGYWMVKAAEHPNANKMGYVFEHILVALRDAGREKLEKDECVHHIDFNRRNNEPRNLVICKKDKHREYHGKLENLVGELLDAGIVVFDKENGYVRKGSDLHAKGE